MGEVVIRRFAEEGLIAGWVKGEKKKIYDAKNVGNPSAACLHLRRFVLSVSGFSPMSLSIYLLVALTIYVKIK